MSSGGSEVVPGHFILLHQGKNDLFLIRERGVIVRGDGRKRLTLLMWSLSRALPATREVLNAIPTAWLHVHWTNQASAKIRLVTFRTEQ